MSLKTSVLVFILALLLTACSSADETPTDGDGVLDGDNDVEMETDLDIDQEMEAESDAEPEAESEQEQECIYIPIVDVNQTWPVVPTGQTTCYSNDDAIPCPAEGEPFYGQDAQYPDNARTFNEYELSGDAVVEDSLTGLMWAKDFAEDLTWTEALEYCDNLEYASSDDWRLPNIHELNSLVSQNTVGSGFGMPSSTRSLLWSSSIVIAQYPQVSAENDRMMDDTEFSTCNSELEAYAVNFWETQPGFHILTLSYQEQTRCVRLEAISSLSEGEPRFTTQEMGNGGKMVTDSVTGLDWMLPTQEPLCWEEALATCANLDFAEQTDWRLPNINELNSLANYGKTNPGTDFPDLFATASWSSTSYNGPRAYVMNYNSGLPISFYLKIAGNIDSGFYCYKITSLCVRGGP
jgi:hypothetical protein